MSCEERRSLTGAPLRCISAAAVTLVMLLLTGGDWVLVSGQDATTVPGMHRRFEYKQSFKGPYLVQKDGTIPFWEHFGHAIASEDSVRITPSLKSKKGSVWAKEQNIHLNWEIEVVFRINGRGRIGADGLAIWYTEDRGVEGPVFGSSDKWKGLGVFFDSFDNDGQRNNPYIMAMVNDGTLVYDHEADGSSQQLGGCLRDFRNKPFPVRVKIEYYQKALTIFFHSGLTNNPDDYELCMRAEGVNINPNGYFGVSAATGGLADDQDVLAFLTHSLMPPAEKPMGIGKDKIFSEEEKKKFEREYDDYRDKLEKAREEYKKEHPTKPGEMIDDDKGYEAQDLKELRMIFDGQNEIHRVVRSLLVKLDEVIGRQERELSMLTLINQGSSGQQQGSQGQASNQLPHASTIQRHEVDSVINSQKDISSNVRELRSILNDVQTRVTDLRSGTSGQGDTSEIVRHLNEVKSHFGGMQNDMKTLLSKPQGSSAACPVSDSCVTPFVLFTFLLGQLACIIGYLIYRNSREAAAKKFY